MAMFGILVEVSSKVPLPSLIPAGGHFSGDGWQIDWGRDCFILREVRKVGLEFNGRVRAQSSHELVDNDRFSVGGKSYMWIDFER